MVFLSDLATNLTKTNFSMVDCLGGNKRDAFGENIWRRVRAISDSSDDKKLDRPNIPIYRDVT